uniref:Uncharacterized protein n=1 Tax=Anguilla anguilla TaxID=7936 RepID=A0A0E9RRD9_ANGAN
MFVPSTVAATSSRRNPCSGGV